MVPPTSGELARSPSLMTVSIRALSLSKGRCP